MLWAHRTRSRACIPSFNGSAKYLKFLNIEDHSLGHVTRHVRKEFPAKPFKTLLRQSSDLRIFIERYGTNPRFRDWNELNSLQLGVVENKSLIITPTQVDWLKQFCSRSVSIDDSHGATRYSLKLTSLLVADERDRGLPAGGCY
ncbi:hypothetical protein OSTOST_05472 [Ostertagia ostertagi]